MLDPEYYADDEDGNEPHGYWIKSAGYERKDREWRDAAQAVHEGRACWIEDAPGYIPF